MKHANAAFFTPALLRWHETENLRSLPWKSEKDPYKIWLSEIILQQTRALQGLPYYQHFTESYPTIMALAAAPDEEVFRAWQGLGYYNRCKNMLATARYIAHELGGKFPVTYEGILGLKGIGPYTAAAIGSFAYGLPCAVVDGNVNRVISRYFGIHTPFDTTEGKKIFSTVAGELLPASGSAAYNQAIMDLGATVCTPGAPICGSCPLQTNCVAFRQGSVGLLPVKSKKIKVTTRYFHYLLLRHENTLWVRKRTGQDIWQNLNEPFLVEAEAPLDIAGIIATKEFKAANLAYSGMEYSGKSIQRLTHRIIDTRFFTFQLEKKPVDTLAGGAWVSVEELKNTAFPKTVLSFLKKNLYF